ncbi:MAG: hypothetical protein ACD_72C00512G0002 [uncultured bacterium]|jgi:predicted transcriptional regulator with HTH domain|nr:MAG: hypothetical protein ACD_72C00512G0002 [uncultured bacterium]
MTGNENEVSGRERVQKSMLGVYDVAIELSENGSLSSSDASLVKDLIRGLESGIMNFDSEISYGLKDKITLQGLIEKIINKCITNADNSRKMAGQETEYSQKLDNFWKRLKEATYGDLNSNRTIN